MILIFDLDDTLYPENTYVESGFNSVAHHLQATRGWDAEESLCYMREVLERKGRGKVFNELLALHGEYRRSAVNDCIKTYRHHQPKIQLADTAKRLFNRLPTPFYLVTDGHKVVQRNKVQALDIESLFAKVYITHHYGLRHAKPSTHCFELIRARERCAWTDMVYVGDNPAKDFVNLNLLGVYTVRVLTGNHKGAIAKPGFEAAQVINSLDQLPSCLSYLSRLSTQAATNN
jgi:putative hydrolase of the HAD superfamily